MQKLVDDFWSETVPHEVKITIFKEILDTERWEIIEDLYFYLWRNNWSHDNNKRYNYELRSEILLNNQIVYKLRRRGIKNRLNLSLTHKINECSTMNQLYEMDELQVKTLNLL